MPHALTCLLLLLLVALCPLRSAELQDDYVPLDVSIAVPASINGSRDITLSLADARFHVVLRNRSTRPVQVFREWCSWGWYNLSFELIASDGSVTAVRKSPRSWGKNFPDLVVLQPNDDLVIPVSFHADEWKDPPLPATGASRKVTLRAIYQVSKDAELPAAWAGKAISETAAYTIWR